MSIYNHTKHYEALLDPLVYRISNPAATAPRQPDKTDGSWLLTLTNRTNNRIDDRAFQFNEFTTETQLHAPPNYSILLFATEELLQKGYALWPKIHHPRDFDSNIKVRLYKLMDVEDLTLPVQSAIQAVIIPSNHCTLSAQSMPVDARKVDAEARMYTAVRSQEVNERVGTSHGGWIL
jgi:hypothetical protein